MYSSPLFGLRTASDILKTHTAHFAAKKGPGSIYPLVSPYPFSPCLLLITASLRYLQYHAIKIDDLDEAISRDMYMKKGELYRKMMVGNKGKL